MNQHDDIDVNAFAHEWRVDTLDISERIAKRIEGQYVAEQFMQDVLAELRLVRSDIATLRRENLSFQMEISRMRSDLGSRPATRIAPFSPSENFARHSGN